ncbi:MAG: lipoate--protein ligase family protein [Limisphaerales bacterium]
MEHWLLLESGPGEPAWNMALDEALLLTAPQRQKPLLRLYGWTLPAATFGYSQRYNEVAAQTHLRPLIRRPTGGGIVPHAQDHTYSIIIPPNQPWHQLRARESYRHTHTWIAQALRLLGLNPNLAPEKHTPVPGVCFAGAEQDDVLCAGQKIAGAAQRRNRSGLLIQGSIQSTLTPRQTQQLPLALQNAAQQIWPCSWNPAPPEPTTNQLAQQLLQEKYASPIHNQSR